MLDLVKAKLIGPPTVRAEGWQAKVERQTKSPKGVCISLTESLHLAQK